MRITNDKTKLELFMIISLSEWKTINLDTSFFWLRGCILASTSMAFLAVNWLARSMPLGDRGITPVAGWVGKHRRIVVCLDSSFFVLFVYICVYDMINDMLCHAVRSPCKDMCMICQNIHVFWRFKWLYAPMP